MAQVAVSPSITDEFAGRFAGSLAMHQRANQVIPGGITHDGRYLKPFPPYIARADGAYKWDVDGNKLIDYVIGHGSLILGHNDPEITAAVRDQVALGTHLGAGHEGEVRWAEAIARVIPSAEKVKFTASGTESTLLAMRVARSYTGRTTILKFEAHFHGWQDYALKGNKPPFDSDAIPGIPRETLGTVDAIPANDAAAVEARLARGDIAALILEPSGASWGTVPLDDGFLAQVRNVTAAAGVVLIFDEVITGFRWAPGGAQERFGVMPDLTTMAKIVAGGLPGGGVAGTAEVMEVLEFKDDRGWNATKKVRHQGTFNANPLAATAGTICVTKCANPSVQATCDRLAGQLRSGVNATFVRRGLPGFAWGESSGFHVAAGVSATNQTGGDLRAPAGFSPTELVKAADTALNTRLHLGLMLEGVELFHGGGFLSIRHTEDDVDQTIAAFDRVLGRLDEEGAFS
ncbi:MAG: aminotransferase class III-fold pyridoxal phosphate-dependent enzyme [Chloroflexia bacterium]|nr:aminotransferase class III-fold pyridoxal phosphate-dependent enzyme [Chloroflexia bacterium]